MTHVFQHSALALSMLSLAACGPSGESGGTTRKQAAEAEPVSYNVPTVEEATPKVPRSRSPSQSPKSRMTARSKQPTSKNPGNPGGFPKSSNNTRSGACLYTPTNS